MHPKTRLYAVMLFDLCAYLLFDVCATFLVAGFIWFWAAFYYQDMRPPDLSGVPHTVSQLQREFVYISSWCIGFASLAAWANYAIVRRVTRSFRVESKTSHRWALGSALVHWVIVFLPSLWPSYDQWVRHTTFKL